jgi:hypothetical protein
MYFTVYIKFSGKADREKQIWPNEDCDDSGDLHVRACTYSKKTKFLNSEKLHYILEANFSPYLF